MRPITFATLPLLAALLPCGTAVAQSTLPPTAPTDSSAVALSLFTPHTAAPRQVAAVAAAPRVSGTGGSQGTAANYGTAGSLSSSHLQQQHPRDGDTLHILAGQSLILHGTVPMKRVYVGNPLILSSFNSSPTEILLTAKEPGTTSLAVWDSNGQNQLYTVSVDVDPSEIQRALDSVYPGMGLTATGVAEHLEVSGALPTQDMVDGLTKAAEKYTKAYINAVRVEPIRPKQVELKLQIIEVDRSKLDQFGVNFTRTGSTPATSSTGQFASPLNLSIGYLKESINLNIQALARADVLQILAEPTLTTLSGGTAKFLSGGEFPVPIAQAATSAGSAATNAITVQFRQYGVKVDFLPVVLDGDAIRLKVAPEVSTLDYGNAVTIAGFTIPALSTRRADTEIELKNGQSFVLSGLLDHRSIDSLGRVPGISQVPILGNFFRSKNLTHSVTELVFVVTASIVDPLAAPQPVTYPKNVAPFMTPDDFEKARQKQGGETLK